MELPLDQVFRLTPAQYEEFTTQMGRRLQTALVEDNLESCVGLVKKMCDLLIQGKARHPQSSNDLAFLLGFLLAYSKTGDKLVRSSASLDDGVNQVDKMLNKMEEILSVASMREVLQEVLNPPLPQPSAYRRAMDILLDGTGTTLADASGRLECFIHDNYYDTPENARRLRAALTDSQLDRAAFVTLVQILYPE